MYRVLGNVKTRALRVLWTLEEMRLFYEFVECPPHGEALAGLSDTGKVPVLLDGDYAISDSVAIMTYLADKHGQLTHPAGTIARAKQDSLTFWLIDEFEAPLWAAAKHAFVLPEEHRVPQLKDTLRWEFARAVEVLARRLADQPFLTGEHMTITDLLAAHCGGWALVAHFPIEDARLNAWLKTMRSRPAFTRALANDTVR